MCYLGIYIFFGIKLMQEFQRRIFDLFVVDIGQICKCSAIMDTIRDTRLHNE